MTNDKKNVFPDVPQRPNFPEIEDRILEFWEKEGIFRESINKRDKGADTKDFVFYDGPPFANGMPHYGHLVTGYIKDVIPRYQTMRGNRVDRRFGWDCHGLPAELETERQLGFSGRDKIIEYGIDKFNQQCRTSALKYTKEWETIVTRQARWVDFERDYKTMDLDYMESVIWAFKQLWEKGLVYEGHRVLPYSWKAETPVSNFETRLDNSYRERIDPAVTVTFELHPQDGDEGTIRLLVWTTTPWTLPSNLALAVGPDIDYAVFLEDGVRYVLGAETIDKYKKQLENAERVGTIKGSELVGRSYTPIFPYFKDAENAFRVLGGDFVDTSEGCGIVHMAPGFGEDDQKVCEANGIAIVCPVDQSGRFTAEVTDFVGQNVLEANKPIIKELKNRGVLVKREDYAHNYPHCWRTDTPLIYKAITSWFVKVTDFRDRMVELNQQINWVPGHIRDGQFGRWLENAQNWSISRNRFWGAPLPVWKSDDPRYPRVDVYGSLEELEADFGVRPKSLHRPDIDELVRPNPDDPTGKSMMRRTPEVFDCWFESGSMPYAQVHYPFENQEWFEENFPSDFIAEYVAQTRGWFYTLMVLSTALFDRPPFRNAVCHGVVLDETGQKLSKRLRNYPDPAEVFKTNGADALRWFLISSPILRGANFLIEKDGKDIGKAARQALIPLWNAYYFFTLYANADGIKPEARADSDFTLDRYILGKTRSLVEEVTQYLDAYDVPSACNAVTAYVDALNNWYIRGSRDRFWSHGENPEKHKAYNTLYTVLTTLSRLLAPLLPMVTEEIFRNLTGEHSVHLTDWVSADDLPDEKQLVAQIDKVREICSITQSIRQDHDLRVRQPLQSLTLVGPELEELRPYFDQIAAETNIKEIRISESFDEHGTFLLKVNAKKVGPRLGKETQTVIKAAREGQWKRVNEDSIEVSGHVLSGEEFELRLQAGEGTGSKQLPDNSAILVVDLTITPELEREGYARDLVRQIQDTRKQMDLHVSDHILLKLDMADDLKPIAEEHRAYIAEQTLADEITIAAQWDATFEQERKLAGKTIRVGLIKVA